MRNLVVIFILILNVSAHGQSAPNSPTSPSFKMNGEAAFVTNSIKYGISHSNKDPGLAGAFWFDWGPQLRAGINGESVGYPGTETHFLFTPNAELKIQFTDNAKLFLNVGQNMYFKSDGRDGLDIKVTFNMYEYQVFIDSESNFLGTKTSLNHFGFGMNSKIFGDINWDNVAGYCMVSTPAYSNFFHVRSVVGYKPGSILYRVGMTFNSGASQFDGMAGLGYFLSATVSY